MAIAAVSMLISCSPKQDSNPFFSDFQTPFGVPPFEQIEAAHYKPAFLEGIKQQNAEIAAIVKNTDFPTFTNTVEPLDYSGELLRNVSAVFYNLAAAETNDTLQALAKEISPLVTAHTDNIFLNDSLFTRVKTVYENMNTETLTREQQKLTERYYKNFVRAGALLSPEQKEQLKEINKKLGLLELQFGENVLAETNDFKLVIEQESDLAGLPDWVKNSAAEEAAAQHLQGKWIFTLHQPSMIPFLQYADRRDLREKIYKAYINRCDRDNAHDNKAIVSQIINLRLQKARLLGFDNYAAFILDDRMAKNQENVDQLLQRVWNYALPKAKAEAAEMQTLLDQEEKGEKLEAWDWWYYTEKIRKAKYDLDEDEIKPYFALDNVRQGAFTVANKLYGLTFTELKNMPVYHPDVKAYEVKDKGGRHLGIFYTDYFPRPGKSSGAWMDNFRPQYVKNGIETRPIIYNVANFTKPAGEMPSLLTIDEARTLFHEFGHALHGLLTQCTYPSISGTSVARDFVELPSQIMEHWAVHPEVLKLYARHYRTGEIIPDSLIRKIQETETFNQGFATTEFVGAGILDMKWHEGTAEQTHDVRSFEQTVANQIGLIDQIAFRYRSPYFSHIFNGGYAVGYYGYLWAEVLDADAFDAFVQHGIFDPATATAFRTRILEKGGTDDPMTLYMDFRGAEPNPESLLKNRGLL